MTYVLATPLYPPEIGGPATDASSLASYLPNLGIQVEVLPFSLVRHLPKIFRHLVYGWRLFKLARRASGIIAFDTVSVGLPAAIAAWFARRPLIVRVPGDYAWEQGYQRFGVQDSIDDFQTKRYGLQVEILRLAQRFVVQSAKLVVAPSEYFKHIVSGWGVRPERLRHIYLGVEMENKTQAPCDMPEGKILFSVGRLVPWKGFVMLIELMLELPKEWHLIIAGDGPLRAELESRVRELGIEKKVTFTGALSHEEVLGWLERADAFALNTSFESFSFQIVEAMASGTPVIATTAGNIPELITDGVEGTLCAPGDKAAFHKAIMSLTEGSEVWQHRTAAARRKAATFSTEASVTTFAAAIKEICV